MDSALHSVSVAAVIVDEQGRMLATRRRDNGYWEPPGGVLELEESILDGLRREVREEIGVEIADPVLTGVYKNMVRGIVALVFRCSLANAVPHGSDEVTELRWMSTDEIRAEMAEAYAIRMLDALDDRVTTVRAHDGFRLSGAPGT